MNHKAAFGGSNDFCSYNRTSFWRNGFPSLVYRCKVNPSQCYILGGSFENSEAPFGPLFARNALMLNPLAHNANSPNHSRTNV